LVEVLGLGLVGVLGLGLVEILGLGFGWGPGVRVLMFGKADIV